MPDGVAVDECTFVLLQSARQIVSRGEGIIAALQHLQVEIDVAQVDFD
jgi:hypothetical protein